MPTDHVKGSPILTHETAQFEFRAYVSNITQLVTSLAVPVFFALGALFCTLVYSDHIKAFLAQYPRLKILTTHPLHVGGGLLFCGGLLFVKKMIDWHSNGDAQSQIVNVKPKASPQIEVDVKKEETSLDVEEIARLHDEIRLQQQEAEELRSQLEELRRTSASHSESKIEKKSEEPSQPVDEKGKEEAYEAEISSLQDLVQSREQESANLRNQLESLKKVLDQESARQDQQKQLAVKVSQLELELENRNKELANLERKLKDSEKQASTLMRQGDYKSKEFRLKANGNRYHIMSGQMALGDVKTIKQGCSASAEEIVISILDASRKPDLYDMMHVPLRVIQSWKEASFKNDGGGLGLILDVKNELKSVRRQILIQPCYNLGNLWDYLSQGKELSVKERCVLFKDVFNGYLALHDEKLIHGDPKGQNIVLDDKQGLHAFIIDADLTHFGDSDATLEADLGYKAKKNTLGTPSCWAPELFFEDDIEKVNRFKAEVWGVGMIAALFLISEPQIIANVVEAIQECHEDEELPHSELKKKFRKKNGCVDFKKTCVRFNKWLNWKDVEMTDPQLESLKPILEKMLQPDPAKRPMLSELKPEVDAVLKKILG